MAATFCSVKKSIYALSVLSGVRMLSIGEYFRRSAQLSRVWRTIFLESAGSDLTLRMELLPKLRMRWGLMAATRIPASSRQRRMGS